MTHVDPRRLVDELVAARPVLDDGEQRLAIALYRLLAEGAPVAPEQLAARTGADPDEIARFFDAQPGLYLDAQGRAVGFWGLALEGMPHRMTVRGRELRAWCAWDTLFLPELLDETAYVASTCPTTGEAIDLVIGPEGVREVRPATAVLSFLRREQPFDADAIKTFCHFVHFFVSAEAAERWTAQHPGTFVLSLADGARIARGVNRASLGSVLHPDAEAG